MAHLFAFIFEEEHDAFVTALDDRHRPNVSLNGSSDGVIREVATDAALRLSDEQGRLEFGFEFSRRSSVPVTGSRIVPRD